MVTPPSRTDVVAQVEQDGVWVVVMTIQQQRSDCCCHVDVNDYELQYIDGDEIAPAVVFQKELRLLNDLLRPLDMPPKQELEAKTSARPQGGVAGRLGNRAP